MTEGHGTPVDRVLDYVVGVSAPALGVITSLQEQVEYALRITSLLIGIVVGAIALYRSIRKLKP
jgi:hypothetical protein